MKRYDFLELTFCEYSRADLLNRRSRKSESKKVDDLAAAFRHMSEMCDKNPYAASWARRYMMYHVAGTEPERFREVAAKVLKPGSDDPIGFEEDTLDYLLALWKIPDALDDYVGRKVRILSPDDCLESDCGTLLKEDGEYGVAFDLSCYCSQRISEMWCVPWNNDYSRWWASDGWRVTGRGTGDRRFLDVENYRHPAQLVKTHPPDKSFWTVSCDKCEECIPAGLWQIRATTYPSECS